MGCCGSEKATEDKANINDKINENENEDEYEDENLVDNTHLNENETNKKKSEETPVNKNLKSEEKINIVNKDIIINNRITTKKGQRNFEEYNEDNINTGEELKGEEIPEVKREKQFEERKEFLVNLQFKNIFKDDNIDKSNSALFLDTTQKVKIILIPTQKKIPKVQKFFDPVQGEPGPFWEASVEASKTEVLYPLWIWKNIEIIFYISGTWKINEELECDCKGIPEQKNIYEKFMKPKIKYKFNNGALIGRLIYGEPFEVYDGLRYTSNYDGPLLLRMNLNSKWSKEKPSGSLNMKVKGATLCNNVSEIEERIGWAKPLRDLEFNNLHDLPDYKIPSIEKMIIVLFNKARYNSKLFAYQYLDSMKNLTPNSQKIYTEFINNSVQNAPLKLNISVIKLLQAFYAPFLSGTITGEASESFIILKTKTILKTYLSKSFNDKKKIFHIAVIKYMDKNPFHLASRLLFENAIRECIFKSTCEEMSMMTVETNGDFKKKIYYSIIILSNEKGNDCINYEISKDVKKFIKEEEKKSGDVIISPIKINIDSVPNIYTINKDK